jgi:hypothetical protein
MSEERNVCGWMKVNGCVCIVGGRLLACRSPGSRSAKVRGGPVELPASESALCNLLTGEA